MASSKPVLHVFSGAIWPSAPWLAVYALGLKDQVEIKQVNLVEGKNFEPDFVKINPGAQLPLLILEDGSTVTTTKNVTEWLINHAATPAGKSSGTDLIARVHADAVDPNFALLSARNDAELSAKAGGVPGIFVRGRQAVLEKYAPITPELSDFYTAKLAANGFLNIVFSDSPPAPVKEGWFAKSEEAWKAIVSFILNDLPAALPDSGYIGGDVPGEDDFHIGAWLARIGAVTGGNPSAEGVQSLKSELGGKEVPDKIVSYWKLWSETDAWKAVYKDGLH
ncbi:hypothetical protein FRC03_001706 [Tulasnella sp. 419]|nr:hypothetical protein FRC02_005134 [Tulasnella sp. 418]KAG8964540.1 hypothetical protein FRC03_001706 [Tulasnella sp. 419]